MFCFKKLLNIKRNYIFNQGEVVRLNKHIGIIEHEKNILLQELNELQMFSNYLMENGDGLYARKYRLHSYISTGLQRLIEKSKNIELTKILEWSTKNNLSKIFNKYGSDKSIGHTYGNFYEHLIDKFENPTILEIGIGSTNDHSYSSGHPGGSIKAFREFLPNSIVIGADIDVESVNSIEQPVFQVDQTDEISLKKLSRELTNFPKIDIIIDDGFHDYHANLFTLLEMKKHLSQKGFYIIEDVHYSMIEMWYLTAYYLELNINILDMRKLVDESVDNILVIFCQQDLS